MTVYRRVEPRRPVGESIPLSRHERVSRPKLRESIEISICSPEFLHAMIEAQGSNARIVDARSRDLGYFDQPMKNLPIAFRLGQHHECR